MQILVDMDVPDIERAIAFYTQALPLKVGRRFDSGFVELLGASSPIYLLEEKEGNRATASTDQKRTYARHWCPVHLDFVVNDIEKAVSNAQAAGAKLEIPLREYSYGKLAVFSDPFGHGFCLIEFSERGYDALL